MKNPKYLLRTLQILTGITVIAIVAMMFGSFSGGDIEGVRPSAAKIKRPKLTGSQTYKELVVNGDKEFSAKNFTEALTIYQKASEIEPREELPYEKIGDIYFLQKNYSQAKQNFELARAIEPEKSNLPLKTVRALLGQRKILDAQAELEKITKPTEQSLFYQGILAAFLNKQEQAKELFKKASEAGTDAGIKNGVQKILNIYRDFELEKDGRIEHLQTLLAQAFDQIGEYGLAIELAFDALKTKNDYRDGWIVLGHAFLNEQKFFDAQDALTKAINLDTNHPAAFFYRGIAHRNLNKVSEAIADFEQALKLGFKPQILPKFELAELLFSQKKLAESFILYSEVVTTDPSDITKFIRPIALAINHLKKPEQALFLAEKAMSAHPESAMAHNLLGWAYMGMKDFGKARNHLEEAIKRDPELSAAYLNLGQLMQIQGNPAEAQKNYEKAAQFAGKANDEISVAIFNTAQEKMLSLQTPVANDANEPLLKKIMPSLSLE